MLIINGKFLSTQGTGVSRVAYELLIQLGNHREELTHLFGSVPIIMAPRGASTMKRELPFKLYNRSLLTWQFWEQLERPARAQRRPAQPVQPFAHPASAHRHHDP
jgi:hypothetical protein